MIPYTFYDAKGLLWRKRVFSLFEALEVNQVLQFTHFYEVDNSSRQNRLKNMKMNKNKKYDEDPRCFWNDREAQDTFTSFLVDVAISVSSISSSSANCEQAFRRIVWMVANIRTATYYSWQRWKAPDALQSTSSKVAPELCQEQKIKRTKLNEELFK